MENAKQFYNKTKELEPNKLLKKVVSDYGVSRQSNRLRLWSSKRYGVFVKETGLKF